MADGSNAATKATGHWAVQGLLIFFLGLTPLVLVEGGLRLFGWPTERVRTFGKLLIFEASEWESSIGVFRPGAKATVMWPPELAYRVHVNQLGLRGPEIEPTPPPGRTRILVLGDSHTFGYYLEEDATWPAQLEARLRADGADVEVVNGGCGAWSIDSQTLFALERGLALEPDHVIVGFFSNDLSDLESEEPLYQSQQRALGGWRSTLTRWVYTSASYELYLRLQVARKESRREDEPLVVRAPTERRDDSQLWARYAEWLTRLRDGLDERGIGLSIVYIPHAEEIVPGVPSGHGETLLAMAHDLGIPAASAHDAFATSGDPGLFHLPHDTHVAEAGAELIAEAAAKTLDPSP